MNRSILIIAAAAFALAGCDAAGPGREDQPSNEAAASASESQPAYSIRPVDTAVVAVANAAPYGQYLVDGQGRALYVLEVSEQQGDPTAAAQRCTDACLGEWPAMFSRGAPGAGDGVDGGRLGTVERDGGAQVTYAGWPLYYYVADRQPGQVSGHHVSDRWGEWYLLSPAGEVIEAGGEANQRAVTTGSDN
ncbi:MAG TPA: hypothetical protein VMN38_06295 [Sphingomicrobium sp.]|nr:hypothetical protein [Sphingomicrobium sp.]